MWLRGASLLCYSLELELDWSARGYLQVVVLDEHAAEGEDVLGQDVADGVADLGLLVCDDADAGRYPSAIEVCDSIDNNCNEEIDEDLGDIWYFDDDGDGYGNNAQAQQSCEQPEGYILQGGDCADSNSEIFPGQEEICDDLDNNCDGQIDEVGNILWYADIKSSRWF